MAIGRIGEPVDPTRRKGSATNITRDLRSRAISSAARVRFTRLTQDDRQGRSFGRGVTLHAAFHNGDHVALKLHTSAGQYRRWR
jgi:hypothetical protein